jgi:hypothetical protein
MRKVNYEGRLINAQPMEFEVAASEEWAVYRMQDGTNIKVKLSVNEIVKTDEYRADGEPIYLLSNYTLNIVTQALPENLKDAVEFIPSKLQ